MVRRLIRRMLESRGYAVVNARSREEYARDGLFTAHNRHFLEDPLVDTLRGPVLSQYSSDESKSRSSGLLGMHQPKTLM